MKGRRPLRARLAFLAVQVIVLIHFGSLIAHNPHRPEYAHYDEANWMWIGHQAWDAVAGGRWDDPIWAEEREGWGSPSPNLGKYFIGAPLWHYLRLNPDRQLHPFGNRLTNPDPSRFPDFELYHPARIQSALFMALSTLLLMDIAAALFGPWVGAIAGLLFVSHPYVESNAFRAMTDTCALFGMMLCLWGFFRVRPWAMALAVGIGLGWAVSTRLNGLIIGLAVFAAIAVEARQTHRWRTAALQVGAALLLAALLFWGTNPHLWRHPISGAAEIFAHSSGRGFVSTGDFRHLVDVAAGLFLQTSSTGFIPGSPTELKIVLAVFSLFGFLAVCRTTDLMRRRLVVASVTLWTLLLLLVPMDWDRYYLIGVAALTLFCAYGVFTASRLLWPWVRRWVQAAQHAEREDAAGAPSP